MLEGRLVRPAAAGLIAVSLLALGACSRLSAPSAAAPTPTVAPKTIAVDVVTARRADLAATLAFSGDVRPKSSLSIVPKLTGRIEKLNVDLGAVVQAGDVIAELDKEQTALSVRQAEASLVAARSRLATVRAGPRAEAVAQAEATARAARARVDALLQASRPEQVAQAQANLEAARQRLAGARSARPETVAIADAQVAQAEARLEGLKKGATVEQLRAAEIGVEQAKNALYAVQVQKDAACSRGGGFQCDAAQKQALAAEEAVKGAEQQLDILRAGPTIEQVAQAEAAVDQARQQAAVARRPASDADVRQAENAVRAAEATLSLVTSPVPAADVDAARAQADAAEAQARLVANPFTPQDVEVAEAQVAQAEAQLELARAQLREHTIVAPIGGVVVERFLVAGSVAGPMTPIVSIAHSHVEIAFNVEESQVGRLQPGLPAKISVPAFSDEALGGKVTIVAPTIDQRTRTALVKVEPEGEAATKLRPGMFAQIQVEAQKKANALVVPRAAILSGTPAAVLRIDGDTVRRVEVQLGVQEREQVEIVDGLREGDQVILDAINLREGDRVAVASAR